MDRGYSDYPESHHNNSNSSSMSPWSSDYNINNHHISRQFPPDFDNSQSGGFAAAANVHYPHAHHHNFNNTTQPTIGAGRDVGFANNSTYLSGRKRPLSNEPFSDGGGFVKLYIAGIPKTATEQDIRSLFGEHGTIVEVVLLKDKVTGQQLESCFVKYSKLEEADLAIEVLNNQHIFPGIALPLKVRYADTEKGRLGKALIPPRLGGSAAQLSKVYVAGLDKQASKREIEELFSTYGFVQDIFMLVDELKQSRGRAFIQFSQRDMAVAAINALNGTYTMRGCDQPLIVRFADPKKPRTGESRGNCQFGSSIPGPPQESVVRPALPATASDQKGRRIMFNNTSSHSVTPQQSSHSGVEPLKVSSTSCTASESSTKMTCWEQEANCLDCDWSEHVCPDGYKYYFNCVTCESKWEKPEEYTLYEKQLQKQQQQQRRNHPRQQEFDHGLVQVATSPVLASPCC